MSHCDQRSINQVSCMCLGKTDTIQFQMTLRAKKKKHNLKAKGRTIAQKSNFTRQK